MIRLLLALLFVASQAPQLGSIQPLAWDGGNHCTAFSINEEEGYWITALHCVVEEDELSIAGEPARVVDECEVCELALLKSDAHAPALKPAKETPPAGTPVIARGYPLGAAALASVNGFLLVPTTTNSAGEVANIYQMYITYGYSGSPVFAGDEVVGTLNFILTGHPEYCGGTPIEFMTELVDAGVWVSPDAHHTN